MQTHKRFMDVHMHTHTRAHTHGCAKIFEYIHMDAYIHILFMRMLYIYICA